MKKYFKMVLLTAAAVVGMAACSGSDSEIDEPVNPGGDEVTASWQGTIKVTAGSDMTASVVSVTPKDTDAPYYVGVFSRNDVGVSSGSALAEKIFDLVGGDMSVTSGADEYEFDELEAGSYYAVVMGWDGHKMTALPKKQSFTVTGSTLSLSVSTPEPGAIAYTVTPNNATATYLAGVVTKAEFEAAATADAFAASVVSKLGSGLSGALKSGAQNFAFTGEVEADYVVYAFFVSADGGKTSGFVSEAVKTISVPLTLSISVTNVTSGSATVSVTPSDNNTTYFYYVAPKAYYDQFKSDEEFIQDDLDYYLEVLGGDMSQVLVSGPDSSPIDNLDPSTQYIAYAYYCNANGTVTKAFTKQAFTTQAPDPNAPRLNPEYTVVPGTKYGWGEDVIGVEVSLKPTSNVASFMWNILFLNDGYTLDDISDAELKNYLQTDEDTQTQDNRVIGFYDTARGKTGYIVGYAMDAAGVAGPVSRVAFVMEIGNTNAGQGGGGDNPGPGGDTSNGPTLSPDLTVVDGAKYASQNPLFANYIGIEVDLNPSADAASFFYTFFNPSISEVSDDAVIAYLIDPENKAKTEDQLVLFFDRAAEGTDVIFAGVAFNAANEHGPLVRLPINLTIGNTASGGGGGGDNPGPGGDNPTPGNASYEDFLGTWVVPTNAGASIWKIAEKVKGSSYTITGIENLAENPYVSGHPLSVEAVYADGKFTIAIQTCGKAYIDDYDGNEYEDVYTGTYTQGTSTYLSKEIGAIIATAALNTDGSMTLTPGTAGSGVVFSGMRWFQVATSVSSNYTLSNEQTPLPATGTRPQEASAAYKKWLGKWDFGGRTFTIGEAVANVSYTLGSFYDGFDVTVSVDFDAASGNILFNYGSTGIGVSAGSNSYTLYKSGLTTDDYVINDAQLNGTSLIATFVMGSDGQSANIQPAASNFAQFGILGYSTAANSWSSFTGMDLYTMPMAIVKTSNAATAKAPLMSAMNPSMNVSSILKGAAPAKPAKVRTNVKVASSRFTPKIATVKSMTASSRFTPAVVKNVETIAPAKTAYRMVK